MTPILYPPLATIDDDLFGVEPGLPAAAAAAPPDRVDTPADTPDMPAYLQELIRRRTDTEAAFRPEPLAVGQIRRLDRVPATEGGGRPIGRVCGVLLGACLGGKRWSGWLVVQESDYAGDCDLVLQEEDGPVAPEAAMVQAWNPVEVVLHGNEALIGKLSVERLGAVMRLAGPHSAESEFVAPRPGRIGAWDLDAGITVVTGTPLGDPDDPRHAYQHLYHRLAAEMCTAARSAPVRVPDRPRTWAGKVLAWLSRLSARPAWSAAVLAIAVVQGVWIFNASGLLSSDDPVYRGDHVRAIDPCAVRIRIAFKPDVPYADAIVTLRRMDAVLVDGPSETGEVWVQVTKDQDAQEVAAMLRQSHLVDAADVIDADKRHCGKQP